MLNENYLVLESLRQPSGVYVASHSSDYNYFWIRDAVYEVMPYLRSHCHRYEKTYHAILDIMRKYEWKLDIHTKVKPVFKHEYIHPRYTLDTLEEVDMEWGNCQHDATGALLWGIAEGEKVGKRIIRDQKDREIVQKLVDYLACCQYWMDPDHGMWEEWEELHSSSLGACVAGLMNIKEQGLANVPSWLITEGQKTLDNMFPFESNDRPVDLAQLSLIYPYKVFSGEDAKHVVNRVEKILLRKRGVIRYLGDSYYALNEHLGRHLPLNHYIGHEAEWTFGLPWLALCQMELGNFEKAKEYIKRTESVMLEDGSLPELYFADSDKYNGNQPLGWSNAMYILAKEKFNQMNS
jgi:phosphorylase kinase alpha/beta subunit